jgi:hypothetical protein
MKIKETNTYSQSCGVFAIYWEHIRKFLDWIVNEIVIGHCCPLPNLCSGSDVFALLELLRIVCWRVSD